MTHCLLCVASIALLIAADDKPKADDAQEKLKGGWALVSVEIDGKDMTTDEAKEWVLTLGDGKYTATNKPEAETGTYRVDASKKPGHLDTTPTNGPLKGITKKMIYQLDGDTLKIARQNNSDARPEDFDNKLLIIVTLKRVKK